jgi:hypothetical protein
MALGVALVLLKGLLALFGGGPLANITPSPLSDELGGTPPAPAAPAAPLPPNLPVPKGEATNDDGVSPLGEANGLNPLGCCRSAGSFAFFPNPKPLDSLPPLCDGRAPPHGLKDMLTSFQTTYLKDPYQSRHSYS